MGVSIPMPEGPYSSWQAGGLDPSRVLEQRQQAQVLLNRNSDDGSSWSYTSGMVSGNERLRQNESRYS